MRYFEDSRTVSVEDLYKVVNEEGERIYSDNLLQKIQSGDFNCLNEINLEDRNNRYFMEPILFAVKNSEFGTYEVFKYYGEELQKQDLTIPTEIVINEPEALEDTTITDNPTLVLHFAKINPEIILYISEDLKSDGEFIEDLCETGNKEAISYAVRECDISEVLQDNPDLASNHVFMKEAVKEDASVLQYANESLKNDYEFIKEAAIANREVIDYVAEHTNEFGKDSINATKEVLVENTTCRAIDEMREELEKVQDAKTKMESQEDFDKDSKEYKNIQIRERQLTNNIRFINQIKNGDVKQERAIRIINAVCKDKEEEYRKDILKYIKMDDAVIAKEKEEKTNNEKGTLEVTPEQIEEKTEDARISKINGATKEIREEYISQTKEEKEVTNYDRGTDE